MCHFLFVFLCQILVSVWVPIWAAGWRPPMSSRLLGKKRPVFGNLVAQTSRFKDLTLAQRFPIIREAMRGRQILKKEHQSKNM